MNLSDLKLIREMANDLKCSTVRMLDGRRLYTGSGVLKEVRRGDSW